MTVTVETFKIPQRGNTITVAINNLTQLAQWAGCIAPQLKAGDVITLNGPMGAGKTTLTQHFGQHLGITERINSPTFVLMHDYQSGQFPLIHVDFYRLGAQGAETLAEELLDIIDGQHSLMIAEWAEYADFLKPFVTYQLNLNAPDAAVDSEKRVLQWTTL